MADQTANPHFVIWRVVDADGTAGEPARCMTVDGLFSCNREADESADAFERRAAAEAARSGRHALIMVPRDVDGAAAGRKAL